MRASRDAESEITFSVQSRGRKKAKSDFFPFKPCRPSSRPLASTTRAEPSSKPFTPLRTNGKRSIKYANSSIPIATTQLTPSLRQYLLFLTPTVVLRMGLATFTGHEAVRQMRIAMWSGVATRKHTPRQVFVHSKDEIMLYGEVEYGLENGKIVVVDFGARMQFQDDKLSLYQVSPFRIVRMLGLTPRQVYLDTTNLKSALAS